MTFQPEPTRAQQALIDHPGNVLVEACPGSGKTRTMVARYRRLVGEESRKGIALVSFTKAAVEEVRQRCADAPQTFSSPNFVGTFDSFINRHITAPLYARRYSHPLEFIESWDSSRFAFIRAARYSLSLEWFDFDLSGQATFVPERVQTIYRAGLIKHVASENHDLCQQARKLRRKLVVDRHIASSSASRWLAAYWLTRPSESSIMARLLGNRFAEIIVDEAQDCGTDEFAVLSFLRTAGVRVTMVADRDQAIYEFRRATPRGLSTFATQLEIGLTLNGNFRSTPAICRLNDSLRSSDSKDEASGERSSLAIPVYLVEFQGEQSIQAAVRRICQPNDVSPSDVVVVAHKRKDARLAAGAVSVSDIGDHNLIVIADTGRILRSRVTEPRLRVNAIESVEWLLIRSVGGDTAGQRTLDGACLTTGLSRPWLRDAAVRVAMAADAATVSREVFTRTVRQTVDRLTWPKHVQLRPLATYFKTPSDRQWQQLDTTPQHECLRWGTVHSVKGREFEAVTLVISKGLNKDDYDRTAIDDWHDGRDSEARRVLYVGASRAEKLLILAVHQKYADQVADLLVRDGVPYRRVNLGASESQKFLGIGSDH